MAAYETIQFDVSDGIARLTLNRPDRLNSFNVQMHDEVRQVLAQVRDDAACRVLVLTGAGRGFPMRTNDESILDAAARAGVELPFSCKAGVCSTCRTKLVRGEVDMAENYALEDWELQQGFILACQSRAKTPEIELTYDET